MGGSGWGKVSDLSDARGREESYAMIFEPLLLDGLLRDNVPGAEKKPYRHALCSHWLALEECT